MKEDECRGVRSSCGRQTVDQFVWVSGFPLRPMTRLYLSLLFSSDNYSILLSKAPSLTRKRVWSLECIHSLVRSVTPNNNTLPSHLRLCSLFVASYDSQGLRWKYSNPPPHGDWVLKYDSILLNLGSRRRQVVGFTTGRFNPGTELFLPTR
jgi:hypothetical protein